MTFGFDSTLDSDGKPWEGEPGEILYEDGLPVIVIGPETSRRWFEAAMWGLVRGIGGTVRMKPGDYNWRPVWMDDE